jgi:agmatine deiminase
LAGQKHPVSQEIFPMVPDWQTNRVYFSRLLPKGVPKLWAKLEKTLKGHGVPIKLLDHTRDIWARDYCPVQVAPGRWVKFRFEPDYLGMMNI